MIAFSIMNTSLSDYNIIKYFSYTSLSSTALNEVMLMIVANILLMLTLMISQQTTPEVDEEGYSIRPDEHATNNGDKNSWYSSDSDSDSGKLSSALRVWWFLSRRHRRLKRRATIFAPTSTPQTMETILVIRFMADLLRKYRGSVVIMVGRGGAEPHYVHNWPPIFSW